MKQMVTCIIAVMIALTFSALGFAQAPTPQSDRPSPETIQPKTPAALQPGQTGVTPTTPATPATKGQTAPVARPKPEQFGVTPTTPATPATPPIPPAK